MPMRKAVVRWSRLRRYSRQLTLRAFFVAFILAILFTFIVMKLNLTTGIIPSLNVSAGLLGFFFVKTWTKFLNQPFTRQENTVIQTCVVAASGIAFSASWDSSLLCPFIMIIDFKLIYPSGTATAHLINSFHTPQGAKLAKKQVKNLGKFFSFSFLWGFFQWFFTAGDNCGFASFPTFGLKAYDNRFYFDFSATYVGVGLTGRGIGIRLIELSPSSLHGLQGYRVFIAIAMILGDGLYNFVKVLGRTILGLSQQLSRRTDIRPVDGQSSPDISYDDQIRTKLFLKDSIPNWVAVAGYVTIGIVSTGKLAIFIVGAWAGSAHGGGVLAGLAACGVMMNIVSTESDLSQDFKTDTCISKIDARRSKIWGWPGSEYAAPYALVYRNMAVLGVEGLGALPKHCLTLCCIFFGGAIAMRDVVGAKWARFVPLPKMDKAKADALGPAVASGFGLCQARYWPWLE
ncbi:hypothetical protein M569_04676 [Genlisea aurea]|uniref:Uncharacterized protein n=1 Tax=Genlisea aurea TaxID=192259 RepID=S8CTA8_9LAMI|nr:hypothetical protein M569_04676 [Genlisea aurea]